MRVSSITKHVQPPANEPFRFNPTVFMPGTKILKGFRTLPCFSSYQWLNRARRKVVPLHTYLQQSLRFHKPNICLNLIRYLKSFFVASGKMPTAVIVTSTVKGPEKAGSVRVSCVRCFLRHVCEGVEQKNKRENDEQRGKKVRQIR